jgi:ParB family chromosome partitioning protein
VGRSRSAASNLLRLLNLAEPVQQMLMAGDLDMGHARALLALRSAQQVMAAHTRSWPRSSACATPSAWWPQAPRGGRRPESARDKSKPRDITASKSAWPTC